MEINMNKAMRDIKGSIEEKMKNARIEIENGNKEAADQILLEVDNLEKDYKREKRVFDFEEEKNGNYHEEKSEDNEEKLNKSFVTFMADSTAKAASLGLALGANGAVVPEHIVNKIVSKVKEISPIVALATSYEAEGDLIIPVYDDDTEADGQTGKIHAAYQGEEFAAITAGQGKFNDVTLKSFAVGALSIISVSLLNNTKMNVIEFVTTKIAEAIAEFLEKELLKGTPGKMTGAVSSTNQTVLTTKTVAGITADVLIDLQLKVPQKYQKNAVWIMESDVFAAVRKLKDKNGNYLLFKDFANGGGWVLLGKPVYTTTSLDKATTSNGFPMLYGDMSGMAFKTAGKIELQVLHEKYAEKHAKGIIAWLDCDSKVENSQKIAVLKSAV